MFSNLHVGKLVSIHDEETQTFLKNEIVTEGGAFWIGGLKAQNSNTWSWQDGTRWSSSYLDWDDDHPKDESGMRLLFLSARSHGTWISKDVEETFGFICQY